MTEPILIDEEKDRRKRLELLREKRVNPYEDKTHRTHTVQQFFDGFVQFPIEQQITLVGRILSIRKHGGLTFIHLQDESGTAQIVLKKDLLGEEPYHFFHEIIDRGDFIETTGQTFTTKKGEQSLQAIHVTLLTKTLLPLPEKWHGLTEVETRYRQRELDLLSNPEVKKRFRLRSQFISALRHCLDAEGFLEVETPILQEIPGGANARPFMTHHNALNEKLYLRIAMELHLKRLIVGGFEKVYEIGRCFRNEGIDYAHNPEFTMLELYWAFVDKETYVSFFENMFLKIIQDLFGTLVLPYGEETNDFNGPWERKTFRETILEKSGIDIDQYRETESLVQATKEKGIVLDFSGCKGIGEYYDHLYKKIARPYIIHPTWVFDYPVEMKPLAKRSPEDSTKSASVQLVVRGAELMNAYYHELNDPLEQEERFMEQEELREKGSEEAQWMDRDFIRALKHGMPPTSGIGIGIDRFIAFLTDAPNLKEVILFPTLRGEKE